MYAMILKDGSTWKLSDNGDIIYDGTRHMAFAPDSSWRVLGFGRRHHSRWLVSLEEAAEGADIGQGWVHDMDHGTRRMWGLPSTRRAVKVTRIP